MKGALANLLVIGAFTLLVSISVAAWWFAQNQLRLASPWPQLIGLGTIGLILLALFRWVLHLQTQERKVLSRSQHELFGEVRHYQDHWEASVPMVNDGEKIEIWGESLNPSSVQTDTITAIRQRYPQLLAQTIDQSADFFQSANISPTTGDLQLESINLPVDGPGTFDLIFDLPAFEKKLPWGITVEFAEFAIVDISDNH